MLLSQTFERHYEELEITFVGGRVSGNFGNAYISPKYESQDPRFSLLLINTLL